MMITQFARTTAPPGTAANIVNSMNTLLQLAQMSSAHAQASAPVVDADNTVSIVVKLTPEYAAMLLENNHNNRTVNTKRVTIMADDIRAGRWRSNGTTITIADTGRLMDGQHRCLAVIDADTSITVRMVFGVPDQVDVFDTIDQGGVRTVNNIMETSGQQTNRSVTATANMLGMLTEGVDLRSRPAQAKFLRTVIDEITPWVEWSRQLSALSPMIESGGNRRARALGDVSLAVLALHMVRAGADPDTVQEFFAGTIMELPTPVLRSLSDNRMTVLKILNRRLKHGTPLNRQTGGSATPRMLTEFALYIRCYNRYIRDEAMTKAQISNEQFRYLVELPAPLPGGKR